MKYSRYLFKGLFTIIFFMVLDPGFASAQSKMDKEMMSRYDRFSSLPREVIYLHLNKTHFLKGEQLGFKAYITDEQSGKPSVNSTNLYVQIVDEGNVVIKEKLCQVKNGVSSGIFEIDDLFDIDNYVIKAFTNWSQNFDEPNTFEQLISIVDLTKTPGETPQNRTDLQVSFMPEGGIL